MGPGVLPEGVFDSSVAIVEAIHATGFTICGILCALIFAVTWKG